VGDERTDVVEEELEELHRDRRLVEPETARAVEPDATVAIGDQEFETFETPGHAVDHLCFETTIAGTTVLFSGDALIEPFRAGAFQVGLDRGADEAIDAYYEAMDRLTETTATHVFPGHGPTFEDPQRTVDTTHDRLDALLEKNASGDRGDRTRHGARDRRRARRRRSAYGSGTRHDRSARHARKSESGIVTDETVSGTTRRRKRIRAPDAAGSTRRSDSLLLVLERTSESSRSSSAGVRR